MGVVVLFALGFTVLSYRLVYLQVDQHDYFKEEAIKMHYVSVPIPPHRGEIRDCAGNVLAQTITATDLRVDCELALRNEDFSRKVAPVLGMEPEALRVKLDPHNRYFLVAENLSEDQLQRLKGLKMRSLIFSERMQRVYPNGSEASHVLGFVNLKQFTTPVTGERVQFEVGEDGIERSMDKYLCGVPGERRVARDASRREIAAYRLADRPPKNGLNVVLSLDQEIQHVVEVEADRLMEEHHPVSVSIIVVKPSTGEILGMTNRPTFDPNNRSTITPEDLRNISVTDVYEPGSTFKLVTLSAALNEGVADLNMPIFCENGRFFYAGKWLTDDHPYGMMTFADVLAKSSNIGFAKVAMLLGPERVYEYAKAFGFGEKTQRDLVSFGAEQAGILRPVDKWTPISITRVPVGYEVAVTRLQLAMAYSAIANDGKLMEPRFVDKVVDNQGNVVAEYLPHVVRQVVRPEVAAKIRKALINVVSDEGTAKLAAVKGFTVAGKTGTAQKLIEGAYDREHYVASFIGFLPADHPAFLVSIVVDQPEGKRYYGGQVAAPAFSRIATEVCQHLQLVPNDAQTAYAQGGGA
jgi:cell division protein FtsI (penicillin-binding protein 3)/stage V sporulation protein D (sporulation-specific penicillin-binding protein)